MLEVDRNESAVLVVGGGIAGISCRLRPYMRGDLLLTGQDIPKCELRGLSDGSHRASLLPNDRG